MKKETKKSSKENKKIKKKLYKEDMMTIRGGTAGTTVSSVVANKARILSDSEF